MTDEQELIVESAFMFTLEDLINGLEQELIDDVRKDFEDYECYEFCEGIVRAVSYYNLNGKKKATEYFNLWKQEQ